MADGINRVTLLGNLCEDPVLRFTQSGQPVLNMRLATNESYLDKDKVRQERADFHNLVMWGPRGAGLAECIRKGSRILAEGALRSSSYENKEGQKVYKVEVNLTNVVLCDGARRGGGDERGESAECHGSEADEQTASGGYGSAQHTTQSSAGYAPRGSAQSAGDFEVAFGRDKGKRISQVQDLSWLRGTLERDLADSSKERFHEKARGQLAAIDAELAKRTGGGARAATGASAGGGGGGYAPRGGARAAAGASAGRPMVAPEDQNSGDYQADPDGFGNDNDIPF